MKNKLSILIPTLFHLGLGNVATVGLYRLALRKGYAQRRMHPGTSYQGPFFRNEAPCQKAPDTLTKASTIKHAEELQEGSLRYFSHEKIHTESPPDWFFNPFDRKKIDQTDQHWSKITNFDSETGDIKTIWEASRFDWAILLARAYRLTRKLHFLTTLNHWVGDWTKKNPLNLGPNWMCSQEASIRLQQLLLTAFLLGQHRTPPLPSLTRFVVEHCRRIEPTIRYAIAQDNNHGTSEAAALFVAGAWLSCVDENPGGKDQGVLWREIGRRWLENRVARLIENDGSFSQYSINYHRVLVDTLNLVEFWRRELVQEKFSESFYQKASAAIEWLNEMTDPQSGDTPNLGANDGARLFVLAETSYRDFRPSVQLGSILFADRRTYPNGAWDEPLQWLGLQSESLKKKNGSPRTSRHYRDGGYVLLRSNTPDREQSWGVIRYPNFRFRPGHADALHFDLWDQGVNVLRDSGSFSYNTEEPWQSYFYSAAAHNTIEFDGHNQMPVLGRFLQGAWLRMEKVGEIDREDGGQISWSGAYKDYWGCRHHRTICSTGRTWRVTDEIEGFRKSAILRWRLAPGPWRVDGTQCLGAEAELEVSCNRPLRRYGLRQGWESRYYLNKNELPVLEIEVAPGTTTLVTEIHLKG